MSNEPALTEGEGRKYSAVERATIKGWAIDPERTPEPPHGYGTGCADKECPCHGRSFIHYARA